MSLRTPLGRVRGLGSAKSGTHHWWHQRLTALALIPLAVWFIVSLLIYTGAGYVEVTGWLASPVVAGIMILLIIATFYHLKLGVQVVVEDYVHAESLKTAMVIVVNAGCLVLGLATVLAVLKLWLGS